MRKYYIISLVAVFMVISVIGFTAGRSFKETTLTTSSQAKPRAQSGITAISDGTTITVSRIPSGVTHVYAYGEKEEENGTISIVQQFRTKTNNQAQITIPKKCGQCSGPIIEVAIEVNGERIKVQESQTTLTAGSFDCSKVTTIPVSECEVLVSLYKSGARGDNWLTGNPCTWEGVLCTDNTGLKYIKELDFANNGLQGSIPIVLGKLSKLYALDLHGNNLTGTIPKELGELKELKWLYMYYTKLTGPIPDSFSKLANLHTVDLDNTVCVPDSLAQWWDALETKPADIPNCTQKQAQTELIDYASETAYMHGAFDTGASGIYRVSLDYASGNEDYFTKTLIDGKPEFILFKQVGVEYSAGDKKLYFTGQDQTRYTIPDYATNNDPMVIKSGNEILVTIGKGSKRDYMILIIK